MLASTSKCPGAVVAATCTTVCAIAHAGVPRLSWHRNARGIRARRSCVSARWCKRGPPKAMGQ
eukprot:4320074-Pyramimonas_sp.AAC.1